MRREVLDHDIRAGKEEALMAVVGPTDQIRRLTLVTVHLQDLRISIGFAYHVALHDESVSDTCIHVQRPFTDEHFRTVVRKPLEWRIVAPEPLVPIVRKAPGNLTISVWETRRAFSMWRSVT